MEKTEKDASFVKKLTNLIVEHFSTPKEIFKNLKTKAGALLKYQFAEVKTKDGATVSFDGEMPMEGMPIFIIPSDGSEPIAPADGVLEIEDGSNITVKGGLIVSVEVKKTETPPPPATGEMGSIGATEQAAIKSIIQSTITETTFSKQEVGEQFNSIKTELEKSKSDFAEIKKANETLHSANETLTKEIAGVMAANAELKSQMEKFNSFSKQLPELLKEFGGTPQVTETEEEKQKRLGTFSNDKAPKMSVAEWREKFMK